MRDYAKAEETLNHCLQVRKKLFATAKIVERAGLEVLIEKVEAKINEVKMAKDQKKELSLST